MVIREPANPRHWQRKELNVQQHASHMAEMLREEARAGARRPQLSRPFPYYPISPLKTLLVLRTKVAGISKYRILVRLNDCQILEFGQNLL